MKKKNKKKLDDSVSHWEFNEQGDNEAMTEKELHDRKTVDKKPVYENEMCKSVGLWASCNACDRIIFEGQKYYEGGYCEHCKTEIEQENPGTKLEEIKTIL